MLCRTKEKCAFEPTKHYLGKEDAVCFSRRGKGNRFQGTKTTGICAEDNRSEGSVSGNNKRV